MTGLFPTFLQSIEAHFHAVLPLIEKYSMVYKIFNLLFGDQIVSWEKMLIKRETDWKIFRFTLLATWYQGQVHSLFPQVYYIPSVII